MGVVNTQMCTLVKMPGGAAAREFCQYTNVYAGKSPGGTAAQGCCQYTNVYVGKNARRGRRHGGVVNTQSIHERVRGAKIPGGQGGNGAGENAPPGGRERRNCARSAPRARGAGISGGCGGKNICAVLLTRPVFRAMVKTILKEYATTLKRR